MTGIIAHTEERSRMQNLAAPLAARLLAATLLLTLAVAVLMTGIAKAFAAPLPRAQILVRGGNITLGDVFDGLERHADFVLAPAPKPGEDLVWNTPTLNRIATAFNLPWRPQEGEAVHIRRAATMVDADTIKVVLREYMAAREAQREGDGFDVSFSQEVPAIIVPTLETPQIEVADINMPAGGGFFSAILRISAPGGAGAQTVTLRGTAERIIRVPVLKHTMKNGAVIDASDLTYTMRPALNVNKTVVTDPQLIVGTTPRQALSAGSWIRNDDIEQPLLISRGDAVTMIFNKGGMYLTSKGRALEDGTMGQVIKVSNASSNKQIEGRVTAEREITIQ